MLLRILRGGELVVVCFSDAWFRTPPLRSTKDGHGGGVEVGMGGGVGAEQVYCIVKLHLFACTYKQ